ncbi:hypothetical protein CKO38_09475 [Rhodospirillum rubrum]|nr:hypothetical protein [Rhodospirillum rubrum]MBK1676895.1 hypothetical protein [Rhodospirillum rubrum]
MRKRPALLRLPHAPPLFRSGFGVFMTFTVDCRPPLLVARFARPQRMVGWAINRPGLCQASAVAWVQVDNGDLPCGIEPRAVLDARLEAAGLGDAVGLLTARTITRYHQARRNVGGASAQVLITLGLGNAERIGAPPAAGRPPDAPHPPGTVNILCHVSTRLDDGALLEALSIATQARTAAIIEGGLIRAGQNRPVTGTGTDCLILACPPEGPASPYAGLHTGVGQAIGAAVYDATREAMDLWISEGGILV